MTISRTIQILRCFWPQIILREEKSKLKDKHILLIKIFLSLLHKFLLSGFYVSVIFKITSGTNLLHKLKTSRQLLFNTGLKINVAIFRYPQAKQKHIS